MFLVQEWLDTRNATVAVGHVLDLCVVCGGPRCSPLLVKLEWPLLDNPLRAAVISVVACARFPTTLSPSSQLSMDILGYSSV